MAADRGRGLHIWLSKVSLALITAAAIVMALASPAAAYWSGQGSATGLASTTTLAAPTNVTAAANGITAVNVSWTAPAGLPASTGYYVTSTKSGVTAAACGSSAQVPITTPSCTDTALTSGTYTYTVVAVRQTWSTSSTPSNSVVVTGPNRLVVTKSPPASVVSGVSIAPAVTVQLQSATGMNLTTSGVPITIKIDSPTATLSGTLTVNTAAGGLATFSTLRVNLVGTYTLTATATGYTAATTTPFVVTAGARTAIVTVSGSGQSTSSGKTFAQPFVVRVTDAAGNPVSGVKIDFTVPAGSSTSAGGTVNGSSPLTAADGTASVTVTASGRTGSYTLTATVSGSNPALTTTFSLTTVVAGAAAAAAKSVTTPSDPPAAPSTSPATPSTPPAALSSAPAAPSTTPAAPSSTPPASQSSATSAPSTPSQ